MALIGNETFALDRQWANQSIHLVNEQPDFFSKSKMRQARVKLIAGSNMLTGIKNWLIAAQLITVGKKNEYFLTNFGKRVIENDNSLSNSGTWWAIHLSICFSDRGEPYISFFRSLNVFTKEWQDFENILSKIKDKITEDPDLEDYSDASLTTNLSGVKSMFVVGGPLADLELIRIKDGAGSTNAMCLGHPQIPDEVIVFALALARHHKFPSRPSIDFSELERIGLTNFLCLSPTQLRKRLQEIGQSQSWRDHFSFTEVHNLDSISFDLSFSKEKALIALLQRGSDTWK